MIPSCCTCSRDGRRDLGDGDLPVEVTLHIYDCILSKIETSSINRVLSVVGTGAFHAAVEVYGAEWSYGFSVYPTRGVFSLPPKGCTDHRYRESIPMGSTTMSRAEVNKLLQKMRTEFLGYDYDLLRRNCCTFSNEFAIRLGVGPIPTWVLNLAAAGATLTDGVIAVGGVIQSARIIAAAKAGKINEKYNVTGPFQVKAKDFLETMQGVNQEYRITELFVGVPSQVISLIEQGPDGLRILAFGSGVASLVVAVLKFPLILNDDEMCSRTYIILLTYNLIFAGTTMIFEASPELIQMAQGLDVYQNVLIDYVGFLATAVGRGLFYAFQGTMWLMFADVYLSGLLAISLSIWDFMLAALHIGVYFGVMPQHVAQKIRAGEIQQQFRKRGFTCCCADADDDAGANREDSRSPAHS